MAEETVVTETKETGSEVKSDFTPTPLDTLFSAEPPSPVETAGKAGEAQTEPKEVEVSTAAVKLETEAVAQPKPINWDDENNPHMAKAAEFEKRYKDTQNWAFKAHQKLKEYGLDDEAQTLTQEEIAAQAEKTQSAFKERERASYAAAIETHGKEFIDKTLYAPDAPFKNLVENPVVFGMVQNADNPVLEALKIVKSYKFFQKYGNDIDKIPSKIREEIETELREKITKELQGKLARKENMPNTLSKVNSKDIRGDDGIFNPTPLSVLFGG